MNPGVNCSSIVAHMAVTLIVTPEEARIIRDRAARFDGRAGGTDVLSRRAWAKVYRGMRDALAERDGSRSLQRL